MQARKLFGDLPVQTLEERRLDAGQLQGEIWRLFVFAMLLFLIAEGLLILPARAPALMPGGAAPRPREREEQPA